MSTDTTVETTKKVATRVGEKVAETNLGPTVVETAEVALTLPSKFVLSGKGAAIAVATSVAVGVGGLYGFQKLQQLRAKKKAAKLVPSSLADVEGVTVVKPTKPKTTGDSNASE